MGILPVPLYVGARSENKDIAVENDCVKPTKPSTGASTFGDIQYAPLTGHYHRLDKDTELPEGLDVVADGEDIGGTHSPTHHTIYPLREMPFTEFVEKFQGQWVVLRWEEGIKIGREGRSHVSGATHRKRYRTLA